MNGIRISRLRTVRSEQDKPPFVRRNEMKKLLTFCAVLIILIVTVAIAHTHYGNSNESVMPTVVAPGDTIDVDFDYTIYHHHSVPQSCPWEIWLDGTTDTRDGVLLASGTISHPADNKTYTLQVDADGLTIPLSTSFGVHTVKIVTNVAFNWHPSYNVYSYMDIDVGPLGVDIDIQPGGKHLPQDCRMAAGGTQGSDDFRSGHCITFLLV